MRPSLRNWRIAGLFGREAPTLHGPGSQTVQLRRPRSDKALAKGLPNIFPRLFPNAFSDTAIFTRFLQVFVFQLARDMGLLLRCGATSNATELKAPSPADKDPRLPHSLSPATCRRDQ